MSSPEIAVMQRIVQLRAEQLQKEGTGYLKAVSQIANELYDTIIEDKDTPISNIQAHGVGEVIGKIPWAKIPWGSLVELVGDALGKFFKGKKAKQEKLEAIRKQITPWVAEAYQN